MRRFGPLLTVLVIVAAGAVLFFVNAVGNPANRDEVAGAAAAPAATEAPDAATSAPAPAAPAVSQKAYAGRTAGREMSLAVAVKDGKAVAYACDGKKIEAWLEGTLDGNTLTLKNDDGSATVTGTADEGGAAGTVMVGTRSFAFTAPSVTAPAGLYLGRADVRGVITKIGWIVEPDGSQTGVATPAGGEPRPAPALDPARPGGVTVDGAPVTVTTIDGDDTVTG